MIFLLPLAFLLLTFVTYSRAAEWRPAMLDSAVILGVFVVVITELLSVPGWLTSATVAVAWIVLILVLLPIVLRLRVGPPFERFGKVALFTIVGHSEAGIAAGVASIAALVLLTGILAPPNTWDAMLYHLPRVFFWAGNHSVAFYPTLDCEQLYMPPLAEYLQLQTYLLNGGDRFVNMIQGLSYLGCAIGVSAIAAKLGLNRVGQLLAAAFAVTIPQGILQASGPKNDYVLAFWLVCLTFSILDSRRKPDVWHSCIIGACVGLACLTKGTAYVYVPPILAAGVLLLPRHLAKIAIVRMVAHIAVIAFLLNAPQFVRNLRLAGAPLGFDSANGEGRFRYANDRITAAGTVSNVLRNLGLHLGTPSSRLNGWFQSGILWTIGAMGADVNDPANTWPGQQFAVSGVSLHEAIAGNPVHLGLIVFSFVVLPFRRNSSIGPLLLGSAILAAFLLFCILIKWQPWNTRLHLSLFVLAAPIVAAAFSFERAPAIPCGLAVVLMLLSVPVVLANPVRPLTGPASIFNTSRGDLYFNDRPELRPSYKAAIESLHSSGCHRIGLDTSQESYEYPLLALLRQADPLVRIQYVGVHNPSAQFESSDTIQPCAIICTGCGRSATKLKQYGGGGVTMAVFGNVVVSGNNIRPSSCEVRFSGGWYARETQGSSWWHWTGGEGHLEVNATENMRLSLRAEFLTIGQTQTVTVLQNGSRLSDWRAQPDFRIEISAARGVTRIDLAGGGAITPPGESRRLAFGLRNLRAETEDGAVRCYVE